MMTNVRRTEQMSVTPFPAKEETDEEFLARLRAMRAKRKAAAEAAEAAKPKPAIVAVVSEKMAEAVRANPESVRLSAKAADETVVVDRPRRTEQIEVIEVEGCQAKLALRHDLTTNERHLIEYEGGYRRTGVVSDYNPMDGLRRREDD
jgi:hypothetical protein